MKNLALMLLFAGLGYGFAYLTDTVLSDQGQHFNIRGLFGFCAALVCGITSVYWLICLNEELRNKMTRPTALNRPEFEQIRRLK